MEEHNYYDSKRKLSNQDISFKLFVFGIIALVLMFVLV